MVSMNDGTQTLALQVFLRIGSRSNGLSKPRLNPELRAGRERDLNCPRLSSNGVTAKRTRKNNRKSPVKTRTSAAFSTRVPETDKTFAQVELTGRSKLAVDLIAERAASGLAQLMCEE
jgi:hypothetical protein